MASRILQQVITLNKSSAVLVVPVFFTFVEPDLESLCTTHTRTGITPCMSWYENVPHLILCS